MLKKRTIALVVPCYNEASRGDGDGDFLKRLQRLNEEIDKDVVTHVVIVDDGSKDDTSTVVKCFIKENNLSSHFILIRMKQNQGKGKALMKGLRCASKLAPYIAYIDADISVSASYLNEALDCCSNGTVVCGNRIRKGNQPLSRKFANKLAKICNKYTIGLKSKDTQCPFKIFPSEGYLKIESNLKGYRWIFDIELLWELERRGYYIQEQYVVFENMDSITLSTAKALVRCAKDILDFKIVRCKRRIDYLKNRRKDPNKKEEALL